MGVTGRYRDMAQDSGSTGFVITKSNCNVQIRFPKWPTTTLFRPFGPMSEENPAQLAPWRYDSEALNFGPWMYPINKMVRGVGTEKLVSFIADIPGQGTSFYEGPYDRLYRIIKKFSNTRPEWKVLFLGGEGTGAPISKAVSAVAIQGALLEYNSKNMMSAPETNCCIILAKSAKTALEQELEKVKPEYENWSPAQRLQAPASELFVSGDVLDPDGGKAIRINCNTGEETTKATTVDWKAARNRGNQSQGEKRTTFPHYEIAFEDFPAPGLDFIRDSWNPWDGIFRYLTEAEQVELLCSAFRKDILMASFVDSPFEEYIPTKIRQSFNASGNTAPGAGPGAGTYQLNRGIPGSKVETRTETLPAGRPHIQTPLAPKAGPWGAAKPAAETPAVEEEMPAPTASVNVFTPSAATNPTLPSDGSNADPGDTFRSQLAKIKAVKEAKEREAAEKAKQEVK